MSDAFEVAKAASTLQLLMRAGRLVDEAGLARVRAHTGHNFRRAHTQLLPYIDLQGTRLTELASRVGISKQGVMQLVDDLERWQVLERVADPSDGRAKLIRFRGAGGGAAVLLAGLRVLGELEAELREHLGDALIRRLHKDLGAVLGHLEGQ